MPGRHLAYLTLLGALNRDDLGVDELEDLVKHDVSLSYRVLRSVIRGYTACATKSLRFATRSSCSGSIKSANGPRSGCSPA